MDKVKYTKVPIGIDGAGKKVWQRIALQDTTEAIRLPGYAKWKRCGYR